MEMIVKLASWVAMTFLMAVSSAAWAESSSDPFIATLSGKNLPVSEYFYNGQSVRDARDNPIGDVNDILLDQGGNVIAVMVGVGGLLGLGEKNVAVPFDALKVVEKEREHYLVLDTSREALALAPAYTFDRGKREWVSVSSP
jgi:PRC-barrel domain